jgi:hypothetical protein
MRVTHQWSGADNSTERLCLFAFGAMGSDLGVWRRAPVRNSFLPADRLSVEWASTCCNARTEDGSESKRREQQDENDL